MQPNLARRESLLSRIQAIAASALLLLSLQAASAATLLSDDFEDGNFTGWTMTGAGSWSVVTDGNKVIKQSTTGVDARANRGDTGWTNYSVEARVKVNSWNPSTGGWVGISARWVESNKHYFFALRPGNQLAILRHNLGISTIASKTYTHTTGTWYTLKLVVNGNTLTGYVDGVQQLSVTDSTFSAGKVALHLRNAVASFDDVVVSDLGPALPTPLLNASSYGAVGNGTTDDTAALQAGLNAAVAQTGTLVLSPGATYKISGQLSVNGGSDFAIDGQGATIRVANGTSNSANPLYFLNCQQWIIARLTVDGNRANRTPQEVAGAHSIKIRGGSDFLLYQVTSTNANCDGFYVDATDASNSATYASDGVFEQCVATNCYRNGLSIITGKSLKILGGNYSGSNGVLPSAGIDLEPNPLPGGGTYIGVENVLIRGITASNNWGNGVLISGPTPDIVRYVTIEDCTFINNSVNNFGGAGRGGAMTIAGRSNLIQNNWISEHGSNVFRGVIDITANPDNTNNVVKGNIIFDNTTTTGMIYIHSVAGSGNQIKNNILTNNASGIRNQNGSCQSGNVIDGVNEGGSCGADPSPVGNQTP